MVKRTFSTFSGGTNAAAASYDSHTMEGLRQMIDNRGISRKGMRVKSDLIGVLMAHDADGTGANPYKRPAEASKKAKSESSSMSHNKEAEASKKAKSDPSPPSSNGAAEKGGLIDITDENSDYSKNTILELKKIIDDRGVSRRGMDIKSDLIGVLQSHDQDPTGQNPYKKPGASSAPKKPKKESKAKPPSYVAPENPDFVDHNSMVTGEKRARDYQAFPDSDYARKIFKVRNEKQYLISRTKGLDKGVPMETFKILGSKDKKKSSTLYTVVFNKSPKCDCIDASIGNSQKCKHVLYVKMHVLKLTGTLLYQLAFLTTELEQIFDNAPQTQLPLISHNPVEDEQIYDGTRKVVEGDCPTCCMDLEEDNAELVWCKGSCGKNVHSECFKMLKQHSHRQQPPCPYCRGLWSKDDEDEPYMKAESGIRAEPDLAVETDTTAETEMKHESEVKHESKMAYEDKENTPSPWDWDEI